MRVPEASNIKKKVETSDREIAWGLRALATLVEDLGLGPRSLMVAQNHL